MKKQVNPMVAAGVILALLVAIGAVAYVRSSGGGGKPEKLQDALQKPGFTDALNKAYQDKYGKK